MFSRKQQNVHGFDNRQDQPRFRCEIVRTLEQLAEVRNDWDNLYNEVIYSSPSQSFLFVEAAWQIFGQSGEFEFIIFLCREGGKLVGLWPIVKKLGPNFLWLECPGF